METTHLDKYLNLSLYKLDQSKTIYILKIRQYLMGTFERRTKNHITCHDDNINITPIFTWAYFGELICPVDLAALT